MGSPRATAKGGPGDEVPRLRMDIKLLTDVEKESIGERQPLPERYLRLADDDRANVHARAVLRRVTEVDDVAVGDGVVLAFEAHFAVIAARRQ